MHGTTIKILGRSLLVAVLASHAPSSLPPHPILSYVYVERLLGAKRGENPWMPNPVNMTDGVRPAVWNPESVSRYEGLYEVGRWHYRHAPEDDKTRRLLRIAGLSWFRSTSLYTVHKHTKLTRTVSCNEFYTVFPVLYCGRKRVRVHGV
jgi:hypothetical protein